MKFNLKAFLIGLAIGAVVTFTLKQCNTETIEVPVTIEVEVPVIEYVHDTIYDPVPVPYAVKEVDTALVAEYKKANDSLKTELFEQAVKINTYKETFDDSIQTITVNAKTVGTLSSLSVDYKTKPRTIKVDTVLQIEVPKNDRSLSPYAEVGVPTNIGEIVFKAGIDYKTKNNWIFGLSYDTDKRRWIKIGKAFNF